MRFPAISVLLPAAALCAAAVVSGCNSPPQTTLTQRRTAQFHQVVGVVSGDTFVADLRLYGGVHRLNVKLIGVRAPLDTETVTEWGAAAATAELARYLARGWVRLEFNNELNEPLRHYDGTLVADQECYVFVPPPDTDFGGHETFLNRALLEDGFVARHPGLAQNDRGRLGEYVDRMDEAEARARSASLGVWSLPR
jgi:endonuclease YncB( thermonuclease family)